jgi:hypothetical protein
LDGLVRCCWRLFLLWCSSLFSSGKEHAQLVPEVKTHARQRRADDLQRHQAGARVGVGLRRPFKGQRETYQTRDRTQEQEKFLNIFKTLSTGLIIFGYLK